MAAEYVVSVVVEAIGNLLNEELGDGKVHRGFKDQVTGLVAVLKGIQCFIRDADAKAAEEYPLVRWVSEVQDVAYDAQDLVERYALRVRSRRSDGDLLKALKRNVCILSDFYLSHEFELEIQAIKQRLLILNESLESYALVRFTMEEGSTSSAPQQFRPTYSFLEEEEQDIVGLEGDVNVLVDWVSEEGKSIVSICGMGGLGKTTLAKRVYNHPKVKRHFTGFAWICVGQQCQVRDIFRRILIQLVPTIKENINLGPEDEVRELYFVLQERKCLIVFDDVWSSDVLELLVQIDIGKDSKILLTTRDQQVARSFGPDGLCYSHRFLTMDESWELVRRKALLGKDVEGPFEMLGKLLSQYCGGLPLALIVLGGILSTKRTLREWETVLKNMRSFHTEDPGDHYRGGIFWILSLSYEDLPGPLKHCFLYLGFFPENTDTKAETLYQLWIAEGLVSTKNLGSQEESLMELAEYYLAELGQRCMVQLRTSNVQTIRRFESCSLHDLMRDWCLGKAREERFFDYIGDSFQRPMAMDHTIRRLLISSSAEDIPEYFPLIKEVSKNIRMLRFVVSESSDGWIEEAIGFQVKNVKMLRVLSVEGLRNKWKLPKDIGKLIHLRYLSFKDSSILTLPLSLTKLKHLQILDLRVSKLGRLPNILWKLVGLTYLYLPSLSKLDHQETKIRLDGLSKLEILENFNDQMCDINDIPKLTNLQILAVHCFQLESLATIANHACSNNRLKHLSISTDCDFKAHTAKGKTALQQSLFGSKIYSFRSEGAIPKFPEWESPISSSLVQLSMNLVGLKGDDVMATLEKLENLRVLFLWRFDGEEMTFHAGGFPQLRILRLFSFLNLRKWVVDKTAMPNLCTLSVWGFTALEMIPDGLQFINTLKELDIRNMPDKFKARIGTTQDGARGEDFYKIEHVSVLLYS